MRFGEVKVETHGDQYLFQVQVSLGDLNPDAVEVELYADGSNGDKPVRQQMKRVRQLVGAVSGYTYGAAVSARRPQTDYTARIIPYSEGASVPLEDTHILWQR